ncbi:hypothetical protein ACHAWU_002959 [Discostella pseudostelligera]|uniref:Uncharacterized protein n=1 Tax=Discostella pseudostelligera TaxID=259834 RepID=A0ABD3LZE3_9STRA
MTSPPSPSPPPPVSSRTNNPNNSSFKNPFSSGLGRGGRMAAWAVAIGVVAAWNYYDNQKNTSESFSKAEQESWNAQKKKQQQQQQDASTSAGSSSK